RAPPANARASRTPSPRHARAWTRPASGTDGTSARWPVCAASSTTRRPSAASAWRRAPGWVRSSRASRRSATASGRRWPGARPNAIAWPPRPPPGSARLRVVVLDGDAAWESAGTAGNDIVVLAPGENLAARVTEIAPARVVVNLAARGALAALQSLRASGCTASFWGCVAAPAADRGVALGTIEASRCPLDPEAIVATLGNHVGRGTPVLTAGTDVDALMSLRQALARLGASVSMAWDGKQAADLLAVVQPEVVV